MGHERRGHDEDCLPPCLIIAGPTASGKSALALRLAERFDGTIINADAMQCYRELRILTARPSEADEARVPHRLYGTLPAAEAGTAAAWRAAALTEIAAAHAAGRLPILCGGTFLYLASLVNGIAQIPEPGPEARAEARALLAEIGSERLHARLGEIDPETAATLRPSDSQRIARAWEVRRGTGAGLVAWHRRPGLSPAPYRFATIVLHPARATLRAAIEARLDAMLASGLLAEIAALAALGLPPTLPAMRAHGVPEFAAHLAGKIGLAEARARTVTATVRYTRRQETWLRHRSMTPAQRTLTIEPEITGVEQQMISESWVSGILLQSQG